jgi:hypothetical protein
MDDEKNAIPVELDTDIPEIEEDIEIPELEGEIEIPEGSFDPAPEIDIGGEELEIPDLDIDGIEPEYIDEPIRDLSGVMNITPEQQNAVYQSMKLKEAEDSFVTAANNRSRNWLIRNLQVLDIPRAGVAAAVLTLQNGGNVEDVTEAVWEQIKDYDKVKAPETKQILFNWLIDSGITTPELARTSVPYTGALGDIALDPLNFTNIGPLKHVSRFAPKKFVQKPIEWGKSVGKKFAIAGTELHPEAFEYYVKNFNRIENMADTPMEQITLSMDATYKNIVDDMFEQSEVARNLLDASDETITVAELKQAITKAYDATAKQFGELKDQAKTSFLGYMGDLDNVAMSKISGVAPSEAAMSGYGDDLLLGSADLTPISMREVKSIISDLDGDVKESMKILEPTSPKNKFIFEARRYINSELRAKVPKYADVMDKEVAPRMEKLNQVKDYLSLNKKNEVQDKLNPQKLKMISIKPENYRKQVASIGILDEVAGTNFKELVKDRYHFDLMKQKSTQGSKKVRSMADIGESIGGYIGGAAGYASGAEEFGIAMSVLAGRQGGKLLGTVAGNIADTYGRPAVRSVIKFGMENENFIKKFDVKVLGKSVPKTAVKWILPGVQNSLVRYFADGDYSYYQDGKVKIDDYSDIKFLLDKVKKDKTLNTKERFDFINRVNLEYIDNGHIMLDAQYGGKPLIPEEKK